jgi:hypothetical protein
MDPAPISEGADYGIAATIVADDGGERWLAFAGDQFSKATPDGLLTNPLHRGQIRTKDGVVTGEHEEIVTAEA